MAHATVAETQSASEAAPFAAAGSSGRCEAQLRSKAEKASSGAENESGDFLGPERFESALSASLDGSVDAVLAHIEETVRAFRGTVGLSDDATMMALRFGANPPPHALV